MNLTRPEKLQTGYYDRPNDGTYSPYELELAIRERIEIDIEQEEAA